MAIQNDGGGSYKPPAKALVNGRATVYPSTTKAAVLPTPKIVSRPANIQNTAPAPAPSPSNDSWSAPDSGSYSLGGTSGGGGGGSYAPAAPAAPAVTQENFLAGDGALLAQKSALQKALEDYTANNTADLSKYNVDYGQAVDNLGWRQAVPDDPATPENEAMAGAWNLEDQNKASGRAFQNQQNDFAGRGMMQSSAYGTAVDGLMRSLKDQLGGMDTAKTNFQQDKARGLASYTNENNAAAQQAQAEAISRYAALYGQL